MGNFYFWRVTLKLNYNYGFCYKFKNALFISWLEILSNLLGLVKLHPDPAPHIKTKPARSLRFNVARQLTWRRWRTTSEALDCENRRLNEFFEEDLPTTAPVPAMIYCIISNAEKMLSKLWGNWMRYNKYSSCHYYLDMFYIVAKL